MLDSIGRQRGGFQVEEIIGVDSGSRDESVQILRRAGARVLTIPAPAFGHGTTRNLAASHAQGDYLVFLTQDATPANADWLENLLAPVVADPLVVGAYSRHTPRPSCHPMEWRRIVQEELSGRLDSRVNSRVNNPDYDRNPAFFYFFANTSSVVRRCTWCDIPWPEVEFGEDQLWAKRVLEAGYKTAYCADSVVYHSHAYGPWTNFRRHFEHVAALPQEARSAAANPPGRVCAGSRPDGPHRPGLLGSGAGADQGARPGSLGAARAELAYRRPPGGMVWRAGTHIAELAPDLVFVPGPHQTPVAKRKERRRISYADCPSRAWASPTRAGRH